MFRKILKVTGIIVGVLVMLVAAYYVKAYITTANRINKKYDVVAQTVSVRADSAMLAKGKRLSVVKGCTECHGQDLGGKIMVDDVPLGLIAASNLTKGKGGLPAEYDVQDWVLALKHGIRKDGKPLLIMPSHEFTLLSENDMAAVIAYCREIPNVDRELPKTDLGPLARILTDVGKLPLIPAEMIDHSRTLVKDVKEEVSIEYGKYLSTSCQG